MKTNIKDYIKVFSNNFFSEKQCQSIINSLDISKKRTHTFSDSRTTKYEPMGKDPYTIFLKDKKIKVMGDLIKSQWHQIITEYVLNWLNKEEKIDWFGGWNGFSFPKFIEYNKGTLMTTHCDHIKEIFSENEKPRGIPTLSIITGLNENYSGGEIMMCEKYKYKLKTGETLIFPSNFLYPHEIKEITKGKRYSMISWVY